MHKDVKILVVGDLMLDHYIWGQCDRISPEAPVQVVKTTNETYKLGGAGNVVENLISLGAKVNVASVIGEDSTGEKIIEILRQVGADTSLIIKEKGRESSIKSRVMASHQQVVRIDKESIGDINMQDDFVSMVTKNLGNFDLVLLSDYAKGVLTDNVCQSIIKECNKHNKYVLIDPKGDDYTKYKNATLLTPNKKEASQATNINIKDKDSLIKAIKKLKDEISLRYSIITLSEEGIALFNEDLEIFEAESKEVFDVTGAGDTVLATLGFMLASNYDIKDAIKTANLAAAVVVGKIGSATATFSEMEELLRSRANADFEHKIKSIDEALVILSKKGNKKLVFTNGCFDILHVGHTKYLSKARDFGDILVVGLNSDDSVKRLKGQTRPINNQDDRASMLSSLGFVDYVIIFDEDTPYELIKKLKPDILVKGADYKDKDVVGSDIVKDVRLVEFVPNKSTTNIINRIKK
ncbi:D,D-heptose 1-phosphate adenosyltransferase / 7-phosphate kinase [Campylobacter pinnipediorum subsp. caledonicus]|uniref:Bifunctional protein HldE n=1 Tax=Campylobacter pinnipediorum subsp. caledonicus TaxID=1874362 RepID=A0A1S6U8B9_9BACT|nr:D-glycero-beta-D-manno-heptose-7-phosphate kinase [Campylobacter pinnipediorum]AQW86080.1 D,D-heptose 1-phosphate adenosyltransferase / 7-phosphate kinase [Campylobacter pinnipediorum subsp. caledonicus]AQW87687.1 D,D-heptose 1-phosphate adenosyltransferase / 7-phosphate kinase [Campylobacter pinnipediorum subsp. caledonicus]OPA72184.1 bifunctional heptose 7-phosphate kinase/heptose 1-phosphate adenyltransferase [Campylobacter pinnipediorum subsp. caledonicus]